MRTGHWLIITVFLCLLGATAWYVVQVWTETSGVSIYGCVAMVLGAIVALVLGFGLMALMFYSNRKGSMNLRKRIKHVSTPRPNLITYWTGWLASAASLLFLYRCFFSIGASHRQWRRWLTSSAR
jgi:hypothetical protein